MHSLLYLVLFSACVFYALGQIHPRPLYPRQNPRRPPPPFDTQDRPWRLPWPRGSSAPSTNTGAPSASTQPPIVLYKRDCDPCMPGWGVKSICNDTTNTVCQPCPMGHWAPHQPHFRPCMPCKKCEKGEFEETTCVSTRDTKCDSCSNPKARINDDYLKKCDWNQLAKNVNPREFDVEVVDMQSKELGHLDGSPEYGSSEDDLDRMLLISPGQQPEHEEDITLDDPEIDLEKPVKVAKKNEQKEDVSKEEEKEWARVVAMRDRADNEVAQVSTRLDIVGRGAAGLDDNMDDEEEEDEFEQGPRRLLLHPIRPLPQMVPAPRASGLNDQEDDMVNPNEPPVENNFPPSYHAYPIDSLLHSGDSQRRKAIVLLVLTCAIVLSTLIFVGCYAREYIRRRGSKYNRVLVVNLSPEEREIVRQSATALEKMDKPPPKKYRSGSAYTTLDDEDPEVGVYVTENPLEAYLNHTDERLVVKEPLVENEVFEEPQVHRRTADA